MVKKNQTEKILIKLDEAAINAFALLKKKLQGEVELFQPDFSKPIELITVATGLLENQNTFSRIIIHFIQNDSSIKIDFR